MPNVIVTRNTYPDTAALRNVLYYVLGKAAATGGYAVDSEMNNALEQMLFVKQAFHKTEALQLKHFFITFADNEDSLTDFDDLLKLGFQVGQLFRCYQVVFGIHLDGSHIHMHFVMNTTSFLDGHQYCDGLSMFKRLCDMLQRQNPRYSVNLYQTRAYSREDPFTEADIGVHQMLK